MHFYLNLCKIEVNIPSFRETLKLPDFRHIDISTIYLDFNCGVTDKTSDIVINFQIAVISYHLIKTVITLIEKSFENSVKFEKLKIHRMNFYLYFPI